MPEIDYQKEAINHFRLSIIDAKLAYTLFKNLYLSRAENVVGKGLFEKYFWTQKQYGGFFTLVEHCAVNAFVLKILHGFDNNKRALTLKDIDRDVYGEFINNKDNAEVLKSIKSLRDKNIAHFDKVQNHEKTLPTFEKIDIFFRNLEKFYDDLAMKIDSSTTLREQDKDLLANLEKVLQNLYVGEKIRLLNIDMKYSWDENPEKISKKTNAK